MVHGVVRPIITQSIVIPTMLQHLWHKSSAPYCMHFDNHLANCNTEDFRMVEGVVKVYTSRF